MSIDIIEKISKGLEIPVEKLLAVRGYEKDSFHADKKETARLRKEGQEKNRMRYGKGNVQNELGKNTNYLLYQLGLTAMFSVK